jgi:hypothetical protein
MNRHPLEPLGHTVPESVKQAIDDPELPGVTWSSVASLARKHGPGVVNDLGELLEGSKYAQQEEESDES